MLLFWRWVSKRVKEAARTGKKPEAKVKTTPKKAAVHRTESREACGARENDFSEGMQLNERTPCWGHAVPWLSSVGKRQLCGKKEERQTETAMKKKADGTGMEGKAAK